MICLSRTVINCHTRLKVSRTGNQRHNGAGHIERRCDIQFQTGCINLFCCREIKRCAAHVAGLFHLAQRNGGNILCVIHSINQILSIVAGLDALNLITIQRYALICIRSKRMLVVGCIRIIIYATENSPRKQSVSIGCQNISYCRQVKHCRTRVHRNGCSLCPAIRDSRRRTIPVDKIHSVHRHAAHYVVHCVGRSRHMAGSRGIEFDACAVGIINAQRLICSARDRTCRCEARRIQDCRRVTDLQRRVCCPCITEARCVNLRGCRCLPGIRQIIRRCAPFLACQHDLVCRHAADGVLHSIRIRRNVAASGGFVANTRRIGVIFNFNRFIVACRRRYGRRDPRGILHQRQGVVHRQCRGNISEGQVRRVNRCPAAKSKRPCQIPARSPGHIAQADL